eukprot:6852542-Pyramimonas_sp.AAC.1
MHGRRMNLRRGAQLRPALGATELTLRPGATRPRGAGDAARRATQPGPENARAACDRALAAPAR